MPIRFSDEEELQSYLKESDLFGLDSEYSGRYDSIIKEFSAKGLDVNIWWVFTSANWECPSCKRSKLEILRPNQHGYLTGHLHEHHDHMSDFVKKEFTRISENRKVVVADLLSHRFVTKTAFAFSAYDNTVLCADCNTADARAKKLVGTPKEFSFSPAEIGRFVIAKPNKDHDIDSKIAFTAWNECRETFHTRSKLVRYIAELAASNSHWYQPSENTAKQTGRSAKNFMRYYGLTEINLANPEQLLYKPKNYAKHVDSWRTKRLQSVNPPPTEGELQLMINLRGQRWNDTPDNWSCLICERSKFECVRKSNSGKWNFAISSAKIFYDSELPRYSKRIKVCNDCSTTATHIGAEAGRLAGIKLSYSSALVTPIELKEVIIPSPHGKHRIDNVSASNLISELVRRINSKRFLQ